MIALKWSNFNDVIKLMESVGKSLIIWRENKKYRNFSNIKNYKTEADQCANEMIEKGLKKIYPKIEIISEESIIHKKNRPEDYWLIDPIDGTASWLNGFDGFVTQAAYMVDKKPVFGIIHSPILKKTWIGLKGNGSKLNGILLPLLAPSSRIIIIDNTPFPHGIAKQIMERLLINEYYESGSLGLKTVLIADGTVDLFIKDICVRDWDIAPASIILSEVGGMLTLTDGRPFIFDGDYEKNNGFIAARDKKILDKTIEKYRDIKNLIK